MEWECIQINKLKTKRILESKKNATAETCDALSGTLQIAAFLGCIFLKNKKKEKKKPFMFRSIPFQSLREV